MFGFMKKHSEKEKEEKDKRKREKKDKKEKKQADDQPLTPEELMRLEEAKRGLLRKSGDSNYVYTVQKHGNSSSSDSLSSTGRETTPDGGMYTSTAKMDISRTVRVPPPVQPKPKPKKGILKGRSNYGPEIPNQGVRGKIDDTITLEENTNLNEILPGEMVPTTDEDEQEEKKWSVKSMVGSIISIIIL